MTKDLVGELVTERTSCNPAFPKLVQEADVRLFHPLSPADFHGARLEQRQPKPLIPLPA